MGFRTALETSLWACLGEFLVWVEVGRLTLSKGGVPPKAGVWTRGGGGSMSQRQSVVRTESGEKAWLLFFVGDTYDCSLESHMV